MTARIRATKRETQLFQEWQLSQQRVAMALTTLTGAQQATVNSEVAFKAAAALKYGSGATFEYANDKLTIKPSGSAIRNGRVGR